MNSIQVLLTGCLLFTNVACTPESEGLESASTLTTTTSTTTTSTTTTTTLPTVNQKTVGGGEDKSCAITAAGVAHSWGADTEGAGGVAGQLGQGLGSVTTVSSPTPLDDAGTTYLSITAGEIGSCGITSTQLVKCWGDNVGDGSGAIRNSPVLINDGTTTYIDIASGSYHNCGVTSTGVLKCWGDGWNGKLGTGNGSAQNSPVIADSGTNYIRVAAGVNHTCGITTAGVVKCWGTNSDGQLGDGTNTSPRLTAVTADPGVSYSEISAGENTTCGVTTDNDLKCWGRNNVGQVGDNTIVTKLSPTVIDSGVKYSKVSVGASAGYHTCAITIAGALKCWGDNGNGQLGIGSTTQSLVPVLVDGGTSYTQIAAGQSATCGRTSTGTLKCWGTNSAGQLGLGNTTNPVSNRSPVVVGTGY